MARGVGYLPRSENGWVARLLDAGAGPGGTRRARRRAGQSVAGRAGCTPGAAAAAGADRGGAQARRGAGGGGDAGAAGRGLRAAAIGFARERG
jgi:hypothetical protein